ncbi:hypothetical protein Slin14017_G107210 [Septoria linicola]|nr:hypothetical protein Slin14017_G107210 [Septoria linicola]
MQKPVTYQVNTTSFVSFRPHIHLTGSSLHQPNQSSGHLHAQSQLWQFSTYRYDIAHRTIPYTYDQVLSIVGNFSNLTYAGSPDGTVKLNGTDNTVGTARTYDLAGSTSSKP